MVAYYQSDALYLSSTGSEDQRNSASRSVGSCILVAQAALGVGLSTARSRIASAKDHQDYGEAA